MPFHEIALKGPHLYSADACVTGSVPQMRHESHRVYEIKLTANLCIALRDSRNAVSFSSDAQKQKSRSSGDLLSSLSPEPVSYALQLAPYET